MSEITEQRLKDVAFLQGSILLLSITGIIAKKASSFQIFTLEFVVIYGLELMIIGTYAVAWQQIIKRFEISVAYANKGSLFIWTFLWARLFYQEHISMNNICGAILIIAGICMVVRHGK